jgi:hypothetical protein
VSESRNPAGKKLLFPMPSAAQFAAAMLRYGVVDPATSVYLKPEQLREQVMPTGALEKERGGSHVAKPKCHHARHACAAERHDAAKIQIVGQHDRVLGNGFGNGITYNWSSLCRFSNLRRNLHANGPANLAVLSKRIWQSLRHVACPRSNL